MDVINQHTMKSVLDFCVSRDNRYLSTKMLGK